tara:strand:- start:170 stop:409 length:240 start_codon:yes stop_codon:yes gene_type:complete
MSWLEVDIGVNSALIKLMVSIMMNLSTLNELFCRERPAGSIDQRESLSRSSAMEERNPGVLVGCGDYFENHEHLRKIEW